MTGPENESLIRTLETKLTSLEKKFAEMELKYNSLVDSSKVQGTHGVENKATNNPGRMPMVVPKSSSESDDITEEVPSPNSRVKILIKAKDPDTGKRIESPEDPEASKSYNSNDYAFILKKNVYDKNSNEQDDSEIDIINLDLWQLLKDHLGDYPFHMFRGPPVSLISPYEPIIFVWDVLKKAAMKKPKDEKDKLAREDLKLLLDFISGGSSGDAKLDKYFKVRDVCREQKTIQFDDLWTIFPPGMLIYGRPFQFQHQLFIVQDSLETWPENHPRTLKLAPWKLASWTYDWTGKKYQRTSFRLLFEPYEGYRPITALPYFPFEFHDECDIIEKELIKRGKDFRELCGSREGSRLFEYKGDALFDHKGFSDRSQDDDDDVEDRLRILLRGMPPMSDGFQLNTTKPSHIDSRVMVDYQSYFHYGPPSARNGLLKPITNDPPCMCDDCRGNTGLASKYRTHFDTELAQKRNIWEDEQYMLCPPRVLGYVLGEKLWAQLAVHGVHKLPDDDTETAWSSRLQLADDRNTKQFLHDLVSSHISSSSSSSSLNAEETGETGLEVDDIIPGKGKGLVILLYGPPGVGKTSTAETIAIAIRKPLFSISVADVGTKASEVERNLSRIFSLATSWQAILLIDEADVFLEKREKGIATSTDRNALVSVFLRVLDYYQGIMFLTTNQIAHFDIAIPSRIHVAIQYESLKPPQMEAIFKGFIEPLENENKVEDYEDILDWLKEDVYPIGFDGRQIRNIITTALGLARAEAKLRNGKGKLSKKHLKSVINRVRLFKNDFTLQYDRYISSQEKMIK